VITPYAAACVSCHDSDASKAHMTANGGKINMERGTVIVADEQCVICHGAGRSADADAVHLNLVPGH
jgi:mono/diheme cytochrome c family protein